MALKNNKNRAAVKTHPTLLLLSSGNWETYKKKKLYIKGTRRPQRENTDYKEN